MSGIRATASTRRKTALAVGIGNLMERFDFAVYGFFATTLEHAPAP